MSQASVAAPYRSVPREFLDPPGPLNPTVGLFLIGYGLAGLTIWGWFVGQWPLPVLLLFLPRVHTGASAASRPCERPQERP